MSVLVGGASNKSLIQPSESVPLMTSDRKASEVSGSKAGPSEESEDGFEVSSPETLLRQLSRGALGVSGDEFQAATPENLCRQFSKSSACDSENEYGDEEQGMPNNFVVSPMLPLKDQLEKDKDDESLRRWKEQLLGSVQLDEEVEDGVDPEVHVTNISIMSSGRPDIIIPLRSSNNKNDSFTLKEGSSYNVKLQFTVRRNIVSGLTYVHSVCRNGFRVDKTRMMLGTFGPRREAYIEVMEEETTPSGLLARGTYTAKTKVSPFPSPYLLATLGVGFF